MQIRTYRSGDEEAQARVYNVAAGRLPGFKPAAPAEIVRRYQRGDPGTKLYAVDAGEVVGYAVFDQNGRVSYPWCLPDAAGAAQEPLFEAVRAAMKSRRLPQAWAAYRADWNPVLERFLEHGFQEARTMINYVAELSRLPHPDASATRIVPLRREDLPALTRLGEGVVAGISPSDSERYFWGNPFFNEGCLMAHRGNDAGAIDGVAVAIVNAAYADPTKIDPNMPCFRLGAFGTERERHKRVNGMFSSLFASEPTGEALLAEAAQRLRQAGVTHMAAQVPSDRPELVAFHDRYFQRQGSFPILARAISGD